MLFLSLPPLSSLSGVRCAYFLSWQRELAPEGTIEAGGRIKPQCPLSLWVSRPYITVNVVGLQWRILREILALRALWAQLQLVIDFRSQ